MKRSLLLIATLFIIHFSEAQKLVYNSIDFGLRAGINVSGLRGDFQDSLNTKYKVGFQLGVYSKYYITDKFKAGFELLLTRKGFKADIFDSAVFGALIYTVNMYQVELPFFIEYDVSKASSFEIGASYALTFYNDKVNSPNISPLLEDPRDITAFAGYNYFVDEYTSLGFRFSYGLNPIIETATTKGYSTNFQILIKSKLF